ncbi:unnamed protein product, partial [Linum tenue]
RCCGGDVASDPAATRLIRDFRDLFSDPEQEERPSSSIIIVNSHLQSPIATVDANKLNCTFFPPMAPASCHLQCRWGPRLLQHHRRQDDGLPLPLFFDYLVGGGSKNLNRGPFRVLGEKRRRLG